MTGPAKPGSILHNLSGRSLGRRALPSEAGAHPPGEALARPEHDHLHVAGADAEALRQVIANLLQNALEAVAAGRAADGRRGLVRLAADARQGCWRLTVCDNGDGPPEGVRRALFDPFVTSKPEGVGLGLALSRQAAEQHGGRIDWRREQGVTRFTLALPITDTEREHG